MLRGARRRRRRPQVSLTLGTDEAGRRQVGGLRPVRVQAVSKCTLSQWRLPGYLLEEHMCMHMYYRICMLLHMHMHMHASSSASRSCTHCDTYYGSTYYGSTYYGTSSSASRSSRYLTSQEPGGACLVTWRGAR